MASKKRLNKIANEGGYNYSHKNPHLLRKIFKKSLHMDATMLRNHEIVLSANRGHGPVIKTFGPGTEEEIKDKVLNLSAERLAEQQEEHEGRWGWAITGVSDYSNDCEHFPLSAID